VVPVLGPRSRTTASRFLPSAKYHRKRRRSRSSRDAGDSIHRAADEFSIDARRFGYAP
jgi:hypothetical protein